MTSLTMKGALQRWAGRLATAATLGLVAAGPGLAAVYVGTFDPQFGAPLTTAIGPFNVGWRGSVTVEANAACLGAAALNSGLASVGSSGCVASVTSASVVLYDMAFPDDDGATLNFAPASLNIFELLFDLSSNNLLGLSSSLSNVVTTPYTASFPGGGPFGPYQHFYLEFLLNADLNECEENPDCERSFYSGPALWVDTSDFACEPGESNCTRSDVRTFPPTLLFTPERSPVPAPAALLLALTALAAAGTVTARSRRRAR